MWDKMSCQSSINNHRIYSIHFKSLFSHIEYDIAHEIQLSSYTTTIKASEISENDECLLETYRKMSRWIAWWCHVMTSLCDVTPPCVRERGISSRVSYLESVQRQSLNWTHHLHLPLSCSGWAAERPCTPPAGRTRTAAGSASPGRTRPAARTSPRTRSCSGSRWWSPPVVLGPGLLASLGSPPASREVSE